MADNVIPVQQIVTEFIVTGDEDLQRVKTLKESLDKKTSVNIDTSKASKSILDVGKAMEQVNNKQLAALKKSFTDLSKQDAFKNLDKSKLSAFEKQIQKSSTEIDVLNKSVTFFKANLDKLNLKPKELAEFNSRIKDSETFINGFGKKIEETGTRSGSLRSKLASVRNELTLLDQAGKSSTQEFKNLQLAAAKLEDELNDNRSAIKALASDTFALDAGIGAVRGLVAGFTAYQGILGLTGEENKEFEKTLLKINGAMAVLQGLQEITNLLQKESAVRIAATTIVNNLYNASLAGTNTLMRIFGIQTVAATGAAKGFQVALASTGVGLLVVAIGALVALNIKLYNTYLDLKNGSKALTDAENEAAKVLIKRLELEEENQKVLKGGLNDRQREIDLLKSKNASLDLINQKEKELLAEQISNNEKRIAELKKSELAYSDVARAELRKRVDENRAAISELTILSATYNKERIEATLDLQQKEAQLNLEATGLWGNELAQRIKLAEIAYRQDLLNYQGTSTEKALFENLALREKVKAIELAKRKIVSTPLDPLFTIPELNASQRALLEKQAAGIATDLVDAIEGNLNKPIPPSVRQAYEGLLKQILTGENINVDEAFKKDLENIFKNLPKVVEEKKKEIKGQPPTSLGELIFGNISDAEKENAKYFDLFLSQSLDFFSRQAQAQIDADNRAIESQQNKVNRFKELAEFGTAEQLQIEQERLTQLQRKREEDVQKQRQIAAAQVAINNIITISNTIAAVSAAFKEGNLLKGILTSAALVATLFGTISQVSSAFGSLPAFDKGSDRLPTGKLERGGQVAVVHPNESILTADQNKAMGYAPNHEKVKYYLLGRSVMDGFSMPDFASSMPGASSGSNDRETKDLLRELITETRELKKSRVNVKQTIDRKGVANIVTEEYLKSERRQAKRG